MLALGLVFQVTKEDKWRNFLMCCGNANSIFSAPMAGFNPTRIFSLQPYKFFLLVVGLVATYCMTPASNATEFSV